MVAQSSVRPFIAFLIEDTRRGTSVDLTLLSRAALHPALAASAIAVLIEAAPHHQDALGRNIGDYLDYWEAQDRGTAITPVATSWFRDRWESRLAGRGPAWNF